MEIACQSVISSSVRDVKVTLGWGDYNAQKLSRHWYLSLQKLQTFLPFCLLKWNRY